MAVNYMEDGTLSEPAPMNAFMKSPSAIIGDGMSCIASSRERALIVIP